MTANQQDIASSIQQRIITFLIVGVWLGGNLRAIRWLWESLRSASVFNLILVSSAVAFFIFQVWRVIQTNYSQDRHLLEIKQKLQLRWFPLLLMFGCSLSAIALRWIGDIPQINLLLFLLGSYGLFGLFIRANLWNKGLVSALLIACVVPFSTSFNSGLGFPVRVLTSHIVEDLLTHWHIAAVSSHDIIVMENGIAQVDLPCSGLRSLWVGTILLLAATWIEKRQLGVFWLLVCAANLVLLAIANTTRVLLLVIIMEVWQQPQIAQIIHIPLGILGFLGACIITWLLLRMVPQYAQLSTAPVHLYDGKQSNRLLAEVGVKVKGEGEKVVKLTKTLSEKHFSQRYNKKQKPASATLFSNAAIWQNHDSKNNNNNELKSIKKTHVSQSWWLLAALISLALVAQIQPQYDYPVTINSIQLPNEIVTKPIPLTESEQRFFDNPANPIAAKKRFNFGNLSGSILLVASSAWQTHHPPELCLVGNGLTVDTMKSKLLTNSVKARWLSLQNGKLSATYWFQSPQRTTDNFLSRIGDYLAHRDKTWVLVSVLFDDSQSPDSEEVQEFAKTIHHAIDFNLNETLDQIQVISNQ